MKTYVEKKTKDGMPDNPGECIWVTEIGGPDHWEVAKIFAGVDLCEMYPTYLVPVSERAVEERAIVMTEMELRLFANRLADYCKNNYNSEEYIQLFVSQFLTKTIK